MTLETFFAPLASKIRNFPFIAITFIGTIAQLGIVISISDVLTGIIVMPNGIAIVLLLRKLKSETLIYESQMKGLKKV